MDEIKFESLEERYHKMLRQTISVSKEDLNENENTLICKSYELWSEKLDDLKIANDNVNRLNIELANYKAMYRNRDERRDIDSDESKNLY